MVSRAPSSLGGLGAEFAPFLRATLWTEANDMSLSVLSALARLDVDPWREAATLASLPRASASRRLAGLLHRLPGGQRPSGDLDVYCDRSVLLLPDGGGGVVNPQGGLLGATAKGRAPVVVALLLLLAAALAAMSVVSAAGRHPSPSPSPSPSTPSARGNPPAAAPARP